MKFIENVGNMSTTATRNGKNLGCNVNVAAYQASKASVVLRLESNGEAVSGVPGIIMANEEYNALKSLQSKTPLFIRALEIFECRTAWNQ